MRTPTVSPADSFQSLDPSLTPAVHHHAGQLLLRAVIAVLAALHLTLLPDLVPGPWWVPAAVTTLYLLLQGGLLLAGHRFGEPVWASHLTALLDTLLLALAIAADAAPALPSLLLVAAFAALAGLRRGQQLIVPAILLLTTALVIAVRLAADTLPAGAVLPVSAGALLLVLATLHLLQRHQQVLRRQCEQTLPDDTGTGLGNRWTLHTAASLLWPYVHRQQIPVTLMYAEFESADGRALSPEQVRLLARELSLRAQERLRGSDIMIRYNARELLFLLLDCESTHIDPIAGDIRSRFEAASRDIGLPAVLRLGATWLPREPMALDQLLNGLHEALQRARHYRQGNTGAVRADPEQHSRGLGRG